MLVTENGTGSKSMNLSRLMVDYSLDDDYYLADIRDVDVIYILDHCYATDPAMRDSVDISRVVEILAGHRW
jgi:hypothetical protein